ncbi:MAG: class I SAM-dependent methyltransferase [Nitrososphaerota archaeon]|jgi:SAM-dependent methyltransferase|uniref:class I SAM-dependent methyltransferase n=1 Tax=Candidatus Bathycorpusculum sp. TaxID=2994959 RepID=UPI0028328033|nr:class I SAM-dependent methyltransferase [Candidatus Termitimicrobium sp.]MCL2431888.1 class I SAM-dependent methyltransferase [Candidatus Termitimicrobium sp.]MDR0492743.1 class I SAM-dependent methyltransferase [Nitrososphaerota archaeon]
MQASSDFSSETHWEMAAKTKMGKYLTRLETGFISKSIDLSQKNLSVMDVGAEAGRFSLLPQNSKAQVVSIDINAYALRRLKQKSRHVNIILADARNLPLKGGVFDIVFMIEVLDYIPELGLALGECRRTLKPGASAVLSFGNKSSIKARLKAMQGKSYRHSYGEMIRCLSKTEFIIKRKLGYSWLPLGRTSQSSIVPAFAALEKIFGLRRIVRYSPWVIMHITRPSQTIEHV